MDDAGTSKNTAQFPSETAKRQYVTNWTSRRTRILWVSKQPSLETIFEEDNEEEEVDMLEQILSRIDETHINKTGHRRRRTHPKT